MPHTHPVVDSDLHFVINPPIGKSETALTVIGKSQKRVTA